MREAGAVRERWELYRNGRPWQRFDSQSMALEAQNDGRKRFPRDTIRIVHIVLR